MSFLYTFALLLLFFSPSFRAVSLYFVFLLEVLPLFLTPLMLTILCAGGDIYQVFRAAHSSAKEMRAWSGETRKK